MGKDQKSTMNEIFNGIDGVALKESPGARFVFPMYMTQSMKEKSIDDLELKPRASNCLKRAGYNTVGDLTKAVSSGTSLMRIRGCGKDTVRDIMENLFLFQYNSLPSDRQDQYLMEVVKVNSCRKTD